MKYPTPEALRIACSRGGKANAGRLTRVRVDAGDDTGETLTDKQIALRLGIAVEVATLRIYRERKRDRPITWRSLSA